MNIINIDTDGTIIFKGQTISLEWFKQYICGEYPIYGIGAEDIITETIISEINKVDLLSPEDEKNVKREILKFLQDLV